MSLVSDKERLDEAERPPNLISATTHLQPPVYLQEIVQASAGRGICNYIGGLGGRLEATWTSFVVSE